MVSVLGVVGAPGVAAEPWDGDSHTRAAPPFQLPFPCGQDWVGATYTDHNPPNSVDFNRADDLGDPVLAAAAGTVSRVENEGDTSYGRWIEIDHGQGWTTRYAHLSRQTVSEGDEVAGGGRIGDLGNTGGSTGPHLHFEQRANGAAVKARFDGKQAHYWGKKTYTSRSAC
ncbi:peptidoglycan DD-metalloendopeptidase family protein [Allosaccharopolyspora coralli]|uniref:Peptidoglycan DD-metalloendopeptidase family protein n=2 Tax=Allosaccharopolyspora coralli TaxID=2665642 RepID=A0A5Q3QFX8_9PSEU|nr:peptidoglycan DD-metalloendopeptidase family protein [Allosaccharopolyspora coralli]